MNERIRELAEQAGADFMRRINYNNLEGKEYEEDAGVIFESTESFEKFVELIVRECIAQCEKNAEHSYLGPGSKLSAFNIKEHFGVKE